MWRKKKTIAATQTAQSSIGHFDGGRHQFPALETDVGAAATESYVVVIGHIDIKVELFRLRHIGGAETAPIFGLTIVAVNYTTEAKIHNIWDTDKWRRYLI